MATITGYTDVAVAVAAAPKYPKPPAKTFDTQSVLDLGFSKIWVFLYFFCDFSLIIC